MQNFFKDGDYEIVKAQILDFFQKYPKSSLCDHLRGVLGDLYLEEEAFEKALNCYSAITDDAIEKKIILNKLQCYYELGRYQMITDEGISLTASDVTSLGDRKNEFTFLMAESLYRQALEETMLSEKRSLASMATTYYEELDDSPYEEVSQFALAEIYSILEEHSRAAETFLKLACSHPEMREELLFRAASSQALFDSDMAIDSYSEVISMRSDHAKEANFNRLILYYQTGEYDKVIASYDDIESIIPRDQMPLFQYILGKSYYSQGDFERANDALGSFISLQTEASPHLKNALLITMSCCHELKDVDHFDDALAHFKELYPGDPQLPKAHFMHAMLLKKSGDVKAVLVELKDLMDSYEDFSQKEGLLFEYAYITHQNEMYGESRETLSTYLTSFPESDRVGSAWKLFMASSLELFKSEAPTYGKRHFYSDLQSVLSMSNLFTENELCEYRFLYGKMAFELGDYADSKGAMQIIAASASFDQKAEAFFYLGLADQKLDVEPSEMCAHFEQVLALDPIYKDRALVHLHLFNGYLADQKDDAAATHLYAALAESEQAIKLENQLWLAGHYYDKAKLHLDNVTLLTEPETVDMKAMVKRSSDLYGNIFLPDGELISIAKDKLYLEPEALKFAELIGAEGKYDQQIDLLRGLAMQQDQNPDWEWNFKRSALFELAKAYEQKKDFPMALETYSFIASRERNVSSHIVNIATFHSAKLRFMLLEEGQRADDNEEIHEILTQLKELQIRKNVQSEPIHLEASIEYAKVRAFLSNAEDRNERYLFFLNRMAEDFASREDLIGTNYHQGLESSPEKNLVYQNYMKYIKAEELRIKALEKRGENRVLEAEELGEQALTILFEIEANEAAREYLHPRVLKSIDQINAAENY